jgi:hypothetical protein
MKAKESARYLLRVTGAFVLLGPLIPIFPALSTLWVVIPAWGIGAMPAFFAASYYFLLTCWWYDPQLPARGAWHFGLFGLLGACCGMLGIFTYTSLPLVQAESVKFFFSGDVFALGLGAVGGFGSAIVVVWFCRVYRRDI